MRFSYGAVTAICTTLFYPSLDAFSFLPRQSTCRQQATFFGPSAASVIRETSPWRSSNSKKSATGFNMVATNELVMDETVAPSAGEATTATRSQRRPRKKTREERLQQSTKGLEVHVVGLSIHHADVNVREKLSIPQHSWNEASRAICSSTGEDAPGVVEEAAVLSTCNRFEVYYSASDPRRAMAHVTQYLSDQSSIPVSQLRKSLFMLSGKDAIYHVMRVAGGLDSLIVGEGQILSQVRQCHLQSIDSNDGWGGKVVARMLRDAVAAGKRVRSETGISRGSVSISSAASELSEQRCLKDVQVPFGKARVAVVGAGKMTRLLVTHLSSRGLVDGLTIVNRSKESVEALQEQFPNVDIAYKAMDELWDVVQQSDIVYTATSSEEHLISKDLMEKNVVGKELGGKPLMLVDISVPRNIADDCKEIPNISSYNVDDLKAVVSRNTALRQREMIAADDILREETADFLSWKEGLSAIVPTINQLQEKAHQYRIEELNKCTRKLTAHSNRNLSRKELEAVERLSLGIVNKLLHGPMSHLRRAETSPEEKQAAVRELAAMFRLEDVEGSNARRGGLNGKRQRRR